MSGDDSIRVPYAAGMITPRVNTIAAPERRVFRPRLNRHRLNRAFLERIIS
jgi:hypothetical protein